MKKILSLIVVLALSAALLIGCSAPAQKDMAAQTQMNTLSQKDSQTQPAGGVLFLKVNPEIALHYDENGKVTKLEGRNCDGVELVKDFTGYAGKDTTLVLEALVERLGEAGYFVEEADGTARKIVLELDPGSQVPNEQFLQDMADHVKSCVESQNWVGEKEYEYSRQIQQPAPAEPKPTPTEPKPSKPAITLCEICGDDDCNDGKYCDDADDLAENLREAENRKNGTPCEVCGEYDCDDGKYCDDRWDDDHDHDDDDHHGHHGRHHKE